MGSKKKVGARVKIALCCSECKRKNYTTMKNKKNTADKMEIKKYCPYDRKHTVHKEVKI
ncbi:50S ribosomal protein L33 [bacterium]|jgi:large subunit ribosomal protein L33|nr:50S ribosomal protein L33 [bacterium]MBO7127642.1 50S ribosomal protein L33 [bacterium]MBQ3368472.1 50S ribosomal protein L33 [bacterium]MBQ4439269.1 50S ribosomal protein L33 [bacterium]MBR4489444.1 50S ribosomal protein L33 [bacterium]